MPLEAFISREFRAETMAVIEQANAIIQEYQEQGFTLTLRQLYYQFVSRDLLKNKQSEYKRLGSIINDARLAGLIDWSAIEDRTRELKPISSWDDPAELVRAAAEQYLEDLWANQSYYPEVWIEKDALTGVIEPVCERLRLPYYACRGYSSQSETYVAGKRLARMARAGQKPVIFHLGDHDPSGLDMTRDNEERLAMFAGRPVRVVRLALNMDQVEQYNPPPNPAKETDSRSGDYIARFGESSWELDALDPPVIDRLITAAVEELIDDDAWKLAEAQENDNKALLEKAADRWGEVSEFLEE